MDLPIDSPKYASLSALAYLAYFDKRMLVISDWVFRESLSIANQPGISCRRHHAMEGKAELHGSFNSSLGGELELFAISR